MQFLKSDEPYSKNNENIQLQGSDRSLGMFYMARIVLNLVVKSWFRTDIILLATKKFMVNKKLQKWLTKDTEEEQVSTNETPKLINGSMCYVINLQTPAEPKRNDKPRRPARNSHTVTKWHHGKKTVLAIALILAGITIALVLWKLY